MPFPGKENTMRPSPVGVVQEARLGKPARLLLSALLVGAMAATSSCGDRTTTGPALQASASTVADGPASRNAQHTVRWGTGLLRCPQVAHASESLTVPSRGAKLNVEPVVLAVPPGALAVVRHHRGDSAQARELCRRSYDVARAVGDDLLTAEALNSLGCLDVATGALDDARRAFLEALELGGQSRDLCARVERNLGIVANIHGDLDEALARYARSLEASQRAGDEHGCALAYHNLGMVSADRELLDEADRYFTRSREIAERAGHVHLQGLCLLNQAAKVDVARQQFEDARRNAEAALTILDRLGAAAEKAGAYRVIGVVYRETGRPALAESRLRSGVELAIAAGSVLNEAETSRELALLYQAMGRNQDALVLLNTAHRLFRRLDAWRDLVHVAGKVAELESTYLAVVREWGQSI